MRILAWAAIASAWASAQNSDFSLLLTGTRNEVRTGQVRATSTEIHYLINYAYQLRERGPHRLYLEFPLTSAGRGRVVVDRDSVSTARNQLFFTPGLRYQFSVSPRVAVYGALGVGLARYRYVEARRNPVSASVANDSALGWNAGGGLDFRWTRLLSLRLETRNFGRATGPGGPSNNAVAAGGFALHF
jgi:opacity protein-like surface antigen